MKYFFYPDVDAIYVEFNDLPYDHSEELDEDRVVHYSINHVPIGVKFLDVREGVRLDDVPHQEEIGRVLEQYKNIPIYA